MPGGEDQYDRLHVLSPAFSGKRKTDRFNPRKLGDNKAPLFLRIPVVDNTDELRDPEGQIAYVTGDGSDSQGLYFRSDTSWTQATVGSESVQDTVNALLAQGNAITLTYDDPNDTLTIAVDDSGIDHGSITGVTADQHHTDPTAGEGLVDEGTNQFGLDVIDSGQVTLSSGTATVDTNISATDATFMLALGADDPGSDVAVAGELFFDTSDGTYEIRIDETDTGVGNPTVNYDIVRVR